MTEIKLYKSNSKAIKLLFLCLPFILVGIWLISVKPNGTWGFYLAWVCTSFFSLGILIGIFNLLDKRPQIIINENGIWDRTIKQPEIKWEQINEIYLLEIHNQKFISVIVNDTFTLKKNSFHWMNKLVGAQDINLNLSQIKIDENKLIDFINRLRKSEKSIRKNHIQNFSYNLESNNSLNTQKYVAYTLILICMLIGSLSNFYVAWGIMISTGIGGFIAKWYRGTKNNSNFRKYAERLAYLGFINLVLLVFLFKAYDNVTNTIGMELLKKIEAYKVEKGIYPSEIKTLQDKLHFNLFEKYIADKIIYERKNSEFILKLKFLNHNLKEFDPELKEWN